MTSSQQGHRPILLVVAVALLMVGVIAGARSFGAPPQNAFGQHSAPRTTLAAEGVTVQSVSYESPDVLAVGIAVNDIGQAPVAARHSAYALWRDSPPGVREIRVHAQSGRASYDATLVAAQLRATHPAPFGEDPHPSGVTDAMAVLAVIAGGGGAVTLFAVRLHRRRSIANLAKSRKSAA